MTRLGDSTRRFRVMYKLFSSRVKPHGSFINITHQIKRLFGKTI
uniref:ORF43h n=1 Tax=Pinus koraiensis TaxID=88728 RepID=A4QM41_PINKO|nr:ORF43h [Pinus koraiensis]